MALADITAKIEADARQQAEAVRNRAQEQIAAMKGAAEQEIAHLKASFDEKFQKERPEILRRRETVAKLDVRREGLNARRAVIARSFDESLGALEGLDREKASRLLEALLLRASETGCEALIVGPKETVLDQAWLDSFNARHGKQHTLSPERNPRIRGGFLLEHGRIRTNCTWEMLLRTFQEDREADVVKQLFAND